MALLFQPLGIVRNFKHALKTLVINSFTLGPKFFSISFEIWEGPVAFFNGTSLMTTSISVTLNSSVKLEYHSSLMLCFVLYSFFQLFQSTVLVGLPFVH